MFNLLKKKLSDWKNSLVKKKPVEVSEEKDIKKEAKEAMKEAHALQKTPASQDEVIDTPHVKHELYEEITHKKTEQTQKPIKEKKSLFQKAKEKISSVEFSEQEFNKQFEELELILIESNIALKVVEKLRQDLKKQLVNKKILKKEIENIVKESLSDSLYNILINPPNILQTIKDHKTEEKTPFVILFFGINGTGKTTTIAKVANFLKENKISSVIAAADTFRAASIEQLEIHGKKLNIPIIKQDYGSDPAAIGFDAIQHAKSHSISVVLVDTAGRMHTKSNLLKEMEKISRVCKPNLKLFVAESTTGNDAIEQAKQFQSSIGIDGSILTKTDVDEKGGTIISISSVTEKPIFFLGTGQNYKDLEIFDKEKFIQRLGL